jgi:hypothetical protein
MISVSTPLSLVALPSELIFYIVSFLDLEDLSVVAQVHSQLYFIVEDCKSMLQGLVEGDDWKVCFYL